MFYSVGKWEEATLTKVVLALIPIMSFSDFYFISSKMFWIYFKEENLVLLLMCCIALKCIFLRAIQSEYSHCCCIDFDDWSELLFHIITKLSIVMELSHIERGYILVNDSSKVISV